MTAATATKKKAAAAKPEPTKTTAVAERKTTSVVSIKEKIAAQIAALAEKTAPPSGVKIRATQDKQWLLPDGTKSRDPLQVIIVDFVSRNQFWPNPFNKDEIEPPSCFAIGDIPKKLVPSANSPEIQADNCAECPNNAFESSPNGKGKACKNSRLMAVLPPDFSDDTPLWLLEASPTALKAFDAYVNTLARTGLAPVSVITTVAFDEAYDYPTMVFNSVEPQPNEHVGEALARIDEARQLLLTEPDVSSYGQEKPVKAPVSRKAAPVSRKAAPARR